MSDYLYAETNSTDPYYNLAAEQYLFETAGRVNDVFFLWQNDNAIIIGKNQNAETEINKEFVAKNNIRVARRLSGGGAVYHDMGNINFTFIVGADETGGINFRRFCEPVAELLRSLGADASVGGRNDITIGGKKVSGNAQYYKNGRCMHHGTIMFDSNLETVTLALAPQADKLESKGVSSIRSRVANVSEYIKGLTLKEFWDKMKISITGGDYADYRFSEADTAAVMKLRNDRYSTWEWNFGASPHYNMRKRRRIEGCGAIEIFCEADDNGVIKSIAFYGDFFGVRDTAELADALAGRRPDENAIRGALKGIDINEYFHNLTMDDFINILLH